MLVTFYSFKGGVGRSMALANVGEILAGRGYDVILCDWDLEAPGLERYVTDDVGEADALRSQPGIMDLLLEYKLALTKPTESRDPLPSDFRRVGALGLRSPLSLATPVGSRRNRSGALRLLTAGRRDGEHERKYNDAVQGFDWSEFYSDWAGASYFEFWRKDLLGADRVILIDSRTGVTEQGGVCTHHLADVVILMTAANDLNLQGSRWMADVLASPDLTEFRGPHRPIQIIPIASRIEQSAQRDELNEFHRDLFAKLGGVIPKALGDPKEFLRDTQIPYKPYYSFKERIAAREPEGTRDEHLFQAYDRIATAVIKTGRAIHGAGTLTSTPSESIPADVLQTLESHELWVRSNSTAGKRADFTKANLSRLDLGSRVLTGAVFEMANLRGARFADAELTNASLAGADASLADFRSARLNGAQLFEATLLNSRLTHAKLDDAQLQSAILVGADLRDASLRGSNLTGARLSQATLEGACLHGADLRTADLHDAIGLTAPQLSRALCTNARLPDTVDSGTTADVLRQRIRIGKTLLQLSCAMGVAVLAFASLLGRDALYESYLLGDVSGTTWFWIAISALLAVYASAAVPVLRVMQRAFQLPATFADGVPAAMKVAPWLPHFLSTETERSVDRQTPPANDALRAIRLYGAPAVLIFLALYYAFAQDPFGTLGAAWLAASSVGLASLIASSTRAVSSTRVLLRPEQRLLRRSLSRFGVAGLVLSISGLALTFVMTEGRVLHRFVPGSPTVVAAGAQVFVTDFGDFVVLDPERGRRIESVNSAGFLTLSPDAVLMVSHGSARHAVVRRAADGELLAILDSTVAVRAAAFSPDGQRIVTVGTDSVLRVWQLDGFRLLRTVRDTFGPSRAVFGEGGTHILTSVADTLRNLWNLETGALTKVRDGMIGMSTSRDGRLLVTREDERWTVRTVNDPDRVLRRISAIQYISTFAFSSDGRLLAQASYGTPVWNTETGERLMESYLDRTATCLSFHPTAPLLLIGDYLGVVTVVHILTGDVVKRHYAHRGGVRSVIFSSDGSYIVSTGINGVVKRFESPNVADAANGPAREAGHRSQNN
jgi:uncharacterized protein YjbI with pentapeptide repeats